MDWRQRTCKYHHQVAGGCWRWNIPVGIVVRLPHRGYNPPFFSLLLVPVMVVSERSQMLRWRSDIITSNN